METQLTTEVNIESLRCAHHAGIETGYKNKQYINPKDKLHRRAYALGYNLGVNQRQYEELEMEVANQNT